MNTKAQSLSLISQIVKDGKGIEIGGPSTLFDDSSILPIYQYVQSLDNCNFSANTLWSAEQDEGQNFVYHDTKTAGLQIIDDASSLSKIPNESYDYLISSHVLEHLANPIKALNEWKRVVKLGGYLILVLPHKNGTFDHQRPVTTLQHIIDDFTNDVQENDLTHLNEILSLHDLSKDPGAGTYESFAKRSQNNQVHRALHHHVFDTLAVAELLCHTGFNILSIEPAWPMHIIAVVQNVSTPDTDRNAMLIREIQSEKLKSPFKDDRRKQC